jgi:hypothetical protein
MKLENNFGRKSIFEMTEVEIEFDSYFCDLNLIHLEKLVKNHRGLKFKRPNNFDDERSDEWFLIVSPSFEPDYEYRITYFDHRGVSSHFDCINYKDVARRLSMSELPHLQEYLTPLEVI